MLAFLLAALFGAVLLTLPFASESRHATPFHAALFTSVSAISVTGLIVVDTPTHWSSFGEVVILALIQLGGFGITTMASLLGIVVFRRMGVRSRLSAQAELGELDFGGIRLLVARVTKYFLIVESIGCLLLAGAVLLTTDTTVPDALWFGVFHSISAFNNAGFSTLSDSMIGFQTNPLVLSLISCLIIIGGIGFPVVSDIVRTRTRWRSWSLHTKITISTTVVLLVAGALAIGAAEWGNDATLGALSIHDRVANAWFASVTPRTTGFNSIDYGVVQQSTLLLTDALMLIGGGSASTAGGIKVTTFAVLGFVIWAEMRGESDVNAFDRRIDERTQRQAVAVALVGVGLAMAGTLILVSLSNLPMDSVAFETLSALNTVGLSTGITAQFSVVGRMVLVALMFAGRLGPLTVATALVLRNRQTLYRLPEGRPLLG